MSDLRAYWSWVRLTEPKAVLQTVIDALPEELVGEVSRHPGGFKVKKLVRSWRDALEWIHAVGDIVRETGVMNSLDAAGGYWGFDLEEIKDGKWKSWKHPRTGKDILDLMRAPGPKDWWPYAGSR